MCCTWCDGGDGGGGVRTPVFLHPSCRPLLRIVVSQIFSCLICYTLKYSDVINEGEGEERSRVSPGVLRVGCMGGLVNRIVVHGTPYNNRRADIRCIRRGLKGSSRVSISFLPLFFHSFSFFSSFER